MSSRKLFPIIVGALLACTAATAHASTFVYTEVGGKGTATFTTSLNTLTVSLANLIDDPANPTGLLTGVGFDISPSSGAVLTSQTGSLRLIADDGTFQDTNNTPLNWTLHTISGEGDLFLDALIPDAQQSVIGDPGTGGVYHGNGIDGNNGHNPFVVTTKNLFTITIAGLTSDSAVTAAIFRYGTNQSQGFTDGDCTSGCDTGSPGTGTPRDVPPVPEPTSLLLLGSGLVGAATAVKKRRRKA